MAKNQHLAAPKVSQQSLQERNVFGARPSVSGYTRTNRQKSGSAWWMWVFAIFQHI